jgi:hypothetical protein
VVAVAVAPTKPMVAPVVLAVVPMALQDQTVASPLPVVVVLNPLAVVPEVALQAAGWARKAPVVKVADQLAVPRVQVVVMVVLAIGAVAVPAALAEQMKIPPVLVVVAAVLVTTTAVWSHQPHSQQAAAQPLETQVTVPEGLQVPAELAALPGLQGQFISTNIKFNLILQSHPDISYNKSTAGQCFYFDTTLS